ncbi:MAG: RNA methyltransferase [Owenweeksia sp.]|nr:RNA methyltransferase [Owenweeksia sp.]MBF99355.1 RNA methyltransferase [Owenweeksia sp.]HCQ17340.1 RNA methyltransferase [Cryomorphaceae bacterium]|tara:strand:+ start:845 stop:2017 length:1173 start_codon:yes stop_codon:yes gene_type:complete
MEALETSFGKNQYVDKVLERLLKSNRKWGARDRAFIAETTYEMVRWWRYLWELYGKEPTLKRRELYRLFGIWWLNEGYELPEDWKSMESVEDFDVERAKQHLPKDVGVLQSFPIWFDELAHKELGDQWPKIATELNRPAELIIRANTLKTNRDTLKSVLKEEGVKTHAFGKNDVGLVIEERQNTFRNPSFQQGLFEVQDGGSQLIAPYLRVKPGMRVIDACAGAGGKSLHLSALMENKGSIISMDVESWKLNELKKRAKRNGAHNIETRLIDSTKVIKRLHGAADRLLLDVPCSGTGVIKRNPDTKWKLQPDHIERVQGMQRDIINDYSKMLKTGGLMVYATCSILRSENEAQVERFLESHPEFELIEQQRINPSAETDGFFMALLEKKA